MTGSLLLQSFSIAIQSFGPIPYSRITSNLVGQTCQLNQQKYITKKKVELAKSQLFPVCNGHTVGRERPRERSGSSLFISLPFIHGQKAYSQDRRQEAHTCNPPNLPINTERWKKKTITGITPESYHHTGRQIRHHSPIRVYTRPRTNRQKKKTNSHNNIIEQSSHQNATI